MRAARLLIDVHGKGVVLSVGCVLSCRAPLRMYLFGTLKVCAGPRALWEIKKVSANCIVLLIGLCLWEVGGRGVFIQFLWRKCFALSSIDIRMFRVRSASTCPTSLRKTGLVQHRRLPHFNGRHVSCDACFASGIPLRAPHSRRKVGGGGGALTTRKPKGQQSVGGE